MQGTIIFCQGCKTNSVSMVFLETFLATVHTDWKEKSQATVTSNIIFLEPKIFWMPVSRDENRSAALLSSDWKMELLIPEPLFSLRSKLMKIDILEGTLQEAMILSPTSGFN